MATVEEWDAYVQEYETNIEDVRTHTQNILNDSTATQAQKENAVRELTIQEIHLQELKAANDNIQETGIVPTSITFGKNNCGSFVFRWGGDSKIHAAMYNPISASGNVRDTDSGVSLGMFLISDVVTVSAKTAYYYPGDPPYNVTFSEYADTSGTYKEFGVHTATAIPSASDVKIKFTSNVLTINDSQFSSSLNTILIRAAVGDLSSPVTWSDVGSYVVPLNLTYVGIVNTPSDIVGGNSPWDYFNNKIKPIVNPDNSVFPNGYNPDPEKPDPEFPELPGEGENGGDDMERNDITGVGGSFGFLTQYALRGSDIENLGQKLWNGFKSNPSDPDYPYDVTKYLLNFVYSVNPDTGSVNMSDIMEFFVSLKMYPFPLGNVHTLVSSGYNLYVGSGTKPIVMNNIIHTMDSYVGKLDCGTLTIPFWFGDYRDYELEIALYLPYCGTVQLNPGDVLGGVMHCEYVIDFCTGSCTAFVDCTTWDNHKITVATLTGQIGADVPMSATNAGRVASRVLNDRIKVAENILSPLKAATTGVGAVMAGNFAGAFRQGFDVFISPAINEQKQLAGMGERGAISAPVLGGGGGFSAFASLPAVFCQVRSPFFTDADNYADAVGLPSSETVIIGECSGFCAFHNVDMSNLNADADAVNEIRRLLESGIFI